MIQIVPLGIIMVNHSHQNDDNELFFRNDNDMSDRSHQNNDNKSFFENDNDMSDYSH